MTKIELISPEQERTLMSAMRSAIGFANSGDMPTASIVKSAREHNLGPEFAMRLAEAFNASKTVSHFKKTAGDARAASFDLADSAEVVKQLYMPDEVEKAAAVTCKLKAHDFFSHQRPTLSKAAAETKPVKKASCMRTTAVTKLHSLRKHLEKLGSDIRVEMLTAQSKAEEAFLKTAELLRSNANAFDQIEYRVVGTYGTAGKRVMDKLWKMADYERFGQKRASSVPDRPVVMANTVVYNTVRNLMAQLDKAAESFVEYESYKKAAVTVTVQQKKADAASDAQDELAGGSIAKDVDPMQLLKGVKAIKDIAQKPPGTPDVAPNFITPGHEAGLRAIKTKMMLNNFMVEDPVLSGYAPADIIGAYNQISTMAPGLSSEPLVMRGLIARVLQTGGRFDPHEARSLYDVEAANRNIRTKGY